MADRASARRRPARRRGHDLRSVGGAPDETFVVRTRRESNPPDGKRERNMRSLALNHARPASALRQPEEQALVVGQPCPWTMSGFPEESIGWLR
jgi:hypothetical protein